MMLTNTKTSYGAIARLFHWAIALLIVTAIGLGLWGESLPRDAQTVDLLKTIYSTHKTIGIAVFFLALARILWAMVNPHPVPLHPGRKLETFGAELVHFALYGAMVIMPLSGWILHAAESGFAPIWWPFGQDLPFVPKSESLGHAAGAVHGLSAWVIYVTVGLHVLGGLKHLIIDRDATVARMTRGVPAGHEGAHASPVFAPVGALVIWAAVILTALLSTVQPHETPVAEAETVTEAAPASAAPQATETTTAATDATTQTATETTGTGWTVQDGSLGFTVQQMGSPVAGQLPDWTADIDYDPETGTGTVTVTIDTTTLSLGTVTDQAKGAEFFNTGAFPQAVFTGQITRDGAGPAHTATGPLTLVGAEAPVVLAFTLEIEGNTARMQGEATLDRRDWNMGASYGDEGTVGFPVTVQVDLTATRG